MSFAHHCSPENAPKMLDWIHNRGGVAIWRSANLSNPGASWSTPALASDGSPMPRQSWEMESAPSEIVRDAGAIGVCFDREITRFRVAVRRASGGFSFRLTDASTRRVRAAVEKAGSGAHYEFDYGSQEAVILVPDREISLADWERTQNVAA